MRNQILTAFTPTPEQIANWHFFLGVLTGVVLTMVATWWFSEYGIDWVIAKWTRRRSATVIDFTERRRLSALVAIRGGR